MSCYNKNTNEYKALQGALKSDIAVDVTIDTWQKMNNSDIIPSVDQINLMQKRMDQQYNLDTKEFADILMANLSRSKIINKYKNNYWVNSSAKKGFAWAKYDKRILDNNLKRLKERLNMWGIPQNAVTYKQVQKYNKENNQFQTLVVVSFNNKAIGPNDLLLKDRNKDMTHIGPILDHLKSIFPQVQIRVMDVASAENLHKQITAGYKKKPAFKDVKSFYYNGQAILIKGRVTSETAIEEVLHPFINHLAADKPQLFNKLANEAARNFPLLTQQINDAYSDRRGFNNIDRQLEIVTQALSRHFKKEYESTPTQGWLSNVKNLLKWLSEYIKDIYNYVTNGQLTLSPGMINDRATLTDIAKLLNTGDMSFKLDLDPSLNTNKIQYKLSDDKQALIDKILKKGSAEQKAVVRRLTNDIVKDSKTYNEISANPFDPDTKTGLVYINSETHTYADAKGRPYASTTEKIKGKLDSDEFQFNIDIGNDFDAVLEEVVLGKTWEQSKDTYKYERISKEQMKYIHEGLAAYTAGLVSDGSILLPQVIVSDPDTMIAGTIDLLLIRKDGSVQVIDLKTSKNSVLRPYYFGEGKGSSKKAQGLFEVKEGSTFYDPTKPYYMSTATQHSMQVNIYRRMLYNMGYTLDSTSDADNTPFTIHMKVDINTDVDVKIGKKNYTVTFDSKGKIITKNLPKDVAEIAKEKFKEGEGKKKYEGFTYEKMQPHPVTSNREKVDKIVPYNPDVETKRKLNEKFKKGSNYSFVKDDSFAEGTSSLPESEIIQSRTYENIYDGLTEFVSKLLTRRESIERMKNSAKLLNSKEEVLQNIDYTISAINTALRGGQADIVFTEVLQKTIEDIEDFETYINNDDNASKPEYISKLNNFQGLVDSMRGLAALKETEGLSERQAKLIVKLQGKLNDLNGVTTEGGNVVKPGTINDKIELFVAKLVQNESNREWTMDDLIGEDGLLKFGKDIGLIAGYGMDMSTQSDTILQLMDKIYKRQRQILFDKVDERNREIRRVTSKLAYLSKDKNKVDYSFMLVYKDGNFTGRYVQKVGANYYNKIDELREPLYDEEGIWKEYIYNANGRYTDEQLNYNKELFKGRKEYRTYLQAEKYNEDTGNVDSGEFHEYSKEYKDARDNYETFVPFANNKGGRWQKKDTISDQEYERFLVKYKEVKDYKQGLYDNTNEFSGRVEPQTDFFVKRKYVQVKDQSSSGLDLIDEKYRALMMKDQSQMTELEKGQKEFYEMYIKFFENDLLKKLPPGVMDSMQGKVPVLRDTMTQSLKQQGSIFTKLYGKMKNNLSQWWHNTASVKRVFTNENGEIIDTMPIFMVGKPRTEKAVSDLETKIAELDKAWAKEKNQTPAKQKKYDDQKNELNQSLRVLLGQPEAYEISQDIGDSLLRFSMMAEHYETMDSVGDTLNAMLKVIENRSYQKASGQKTVTRIKGVLKKVGIKSKTGLDEPRIVSRAKKWMKMVYYDNDQEIKGKFDKFADGLLNITSLTYVGFNPFGNFNNYMVGRLSNAIEVVGGRYFEAGAYGRASMEFNKRMVPDMIKRAGEKSSLADKIRMGKASIEDYNPTSKYESMVEFFRMMDAKSDIREATRSQTGKESGFKKVMEWGYILQDAAEYNVQTKTGMAILMTLMVKNDQGDTMSLYDALEYDSETGKSTIAKGYNKVQKVFSNRSPDIQKETDWKDWSQSARFDVRNYIREVNKIVHGNYAYEDRTVMQANALGRLVMQFHKWIIPTYSARLRYSYYDENLGWVQGRYWTGIEFLKYFAQNLKDFGDITTNFKESQGEQGQMKIDNLKRNLGEAGVIGMSFLVRLILLSLIDDEDEDKARWRKQAENILLYQLDRQRREFSQFINPGDFLEMTKSPYAAHKAASNFYKALTLSSSTFTKGIIPMIWGRGLLKEDFWDNQDLVYQRTTRKGQLKVKKAWLNVIPALYTLEKLKKYESMRDFYVK